MLSESAIKYFTYGIIAIVSIAVVGGFFIVGSPFEERIRRFDERRVSDLQFIQNEIINYWINKEALAPDLSSIRDDIRGISIPKDPETSQDYEYRLLGKLEFELCATFSRPSTSLDSSQTRPVADPYSAENWEHKEGKACFKRTIDPDIYRPAKKIPQ